MSNTLAQRQLSLICLILALALFACSAGPEPSGDNAVDPTVAATATTKTLPTPTLIPVTPSATATPTRMPTATPTPTPTLTPSPTATATRLPTLTPLPTKLPTETPAPTVTPELEDVYDLDDTYAVIGVTRDDVLNIRAEPNASAPIVGTLSPVAQDITISAETRSLTSTWVEVRQGDVVGWVNAAYLARQIGSTNLAIADTALEALIALREQDFERFAKLVHPELGVRFVPQTWIEETNPVFSAEQLPTLLDDPTLYEWGSNFASDEIITMTFRDYYAKHIFPNDYLFADAIGYDSNILLGGMIDNSTEFYADAHFVEYHFDGFNADYGGLDFRTLRIVLAPHDNTYAVVAVVDNTWTP